MRDFQELLFMWVIPINIYHIWNEKWKHLKTKNPLHVTINSILLARSSCLLSHLICCDITCQVTCGILRYILIRKWKGKKEKCLSILINNSFDLVKSWKGLRDSLGGPGPDIENHSWGQNGMKIGIPMWPHGRKPCHPTHPRPSTNIHLCVNDK